MRHFPDWAEKIGEDWMENPIQSLTVVRLSEFSGSADGACRVEFAVDGSRVGFVKPREDKSSCVVAHEKIASDLAAKLGLPVPPVLIRKSEAGNEWDRLTALSLACLPSPRHWAEAPLAMTDYSASVLEQLRVFWSWIGDYDHNNHPANLLYQLRGEGSPQFLSIDHSYILPDCGDPLTTQACGGYDSGTHAAAPAARDRMMNLIEALDRLMVQHLVTRLVGVVLTVDQANGKIDWLERRRDVLRRLF
jgi:hypothetical protein